MREFEIVVAWSPYRWKARIFDIENPITVEGRDRQSCIDKCIAQMAKRDRHEYIILDLTQMTEEEVEIYNEEHETNLLHKWT